MMQELKRNPDQLVFYVCLFAACALAVLDMLEVVQR